MPTLATLPSQEPDVAVTRGRSPALRDRDSPLKRRGAPVPSGMCSCTEPRGASQAPRMLRAPLHPRLHREHLDQSSRFTDHTHGCREQVRGLTLTPTQQWGRSKRCPSTPHNSPGEQKQLGGWGATDRQDRQTPGALSPGVQTWSSVQGLQRPHQTACHPTKAD